MGHAGSLRLFLPTICAKNQDPIISTTEESRTESRNWSVECYGTWKKSHLAEMCVFGRRRTFLGGSLMHGTTRTHFTNTLTLINVVPSACKLTCQTGKRSQTVDILSRNHGADVPVSSQIGFLHLPDATFWPTDIRCDVTRASVNAVVGRHWLKLKCWLRSTFNYMTEYCRRWLLSFS